MITKQAQTINKTKFKNVFSLSHSVSIFVPSTSEINKNVDNTKQVNEVLEKLSNLNGGASAINLTGAWVSDTAGLVLENTVKVFSNCEEITEEILNVVYDIAEEIKKSMSQDAVAVEIDSTLYFV